MTSHNAMLTLNCLRCLISFIYHLDHIHSPGSLLNIHPAVLLKPVFNRVCSVAQQVNAWLHQLQLLLTQFISSIQISLPTQPQLANSFFHLWIMCFCFQMIFGKFLLRSPFNLHWQFLFSVVMRIYILHYADGILFLLQIAAFLKTIIKSTTAKSTVLDIE